MRRVLIVQPSFQPPGGGNAVAAWMVQALAERCDLSLLVWERLDAEPIDRAFGTGLRRLRFTLHRVAPRVRRLVDLVPTRHALLQMSAMLRACRRLHRRHRYDVLVTANNEADFGIRGIQYVHYPWASLPRPATDLRWYHRFPGSVPAYWALCGLVASRSWPRMRGNLTLVNSAFVAAKVREVHGTEPVVLHPPVAGEFPEPEVPWDARADGFVCVGRLSPEKELEKVIDIVAAVRARGHDVRLHLVGPSDDPAYAARVRAAARPHAAWVHLADDLARDALVELMARNRYGIHGMVGEHFGIAVAELQRAGCIVFVPHVGGPVEIVGPDERLLYRSPADAAAKIDRVLRDPGLQASLRAAAAARRDLFSADRFVRRFREIVDGFAP